MSALWPFYPIITLPDPVLRKISDPVERVDDAVVKLMDDMLETMYAAPGVGLAAVQVGVPRRIVVLDVGEEGAPPATDRNGKSGAGGSRVDDAAARRGMSLHSRRARRNRKTGKR